MEKALHVPSFFQKWIIAILEKMCITDWAGGDGEFRVRKLPLEIALDANSVPPWEVLQESGDSAPAPASELIALYPNLWLLVDQADLDPVDLVVGASSGSP